MTKTFTFSPLVSACILDPRIQNAVDDLTRKTMAKGFDPSFSWAEFPSYIDTWLAAQQTVAEWCKEQCRLWDATWGVILGAALAYPRRVDTQDDLAVGGIFECWQEGWLSRHVVVAGQAVGLTLRCGYENASLEVEFANDLTRAQYKALSLPDWTLDGCEITSPPVRVREDEGGAATVNLIELREHVANALSALNV